MIECTDCLIVFLVALYSPNRHEEADAKQSKNLMGYICERTTSNEDGAHGIDEVVYRVDIGELVMPLVHILSRLLHDILM